MKIGVLFWILMLLWLILGSWYFWGSWGPVGVNFGVWILLALLGWASFGPPLQR